MKLFKTEQTLASGCTNIALIFSPGLGIAMSPSCPLCKSKNITKSKRRGWLESFIYLLGHIHAYRCLACDNRFFRRSHHESRAVNTMSASSVLHRRNGLQGELFLGSSGEK